MAINYKLDDAHRDYRTLLPACLNPLAAKYPQAKLREVRLFKFDINNHSLANADHDGIIEFNPYWFAREPRLLQEAALDHPEIDVSGHMLKWHRDATDEPLQVAAHEFGHILAQQIPTCLRWAKPAWEKATRDPSLAPSAYGLVNDSEFWAECFCMYELGLAPDWMRDEIAELLVT